MMLALIAHGDRQQRPAARIGTRRAGDRPAAARLQLAGHARCRSRSSASRCSISPAAREIARSPSSGSFRRVIAASLPMFVDRLGDGGVPARRIRRGAAGADRGSRSHGWTFEASFAIALAVNVLIVVEGIARYRVNLDADERRRIQIVVYTGVPAVFAYALKTGIPLVVGRSLGTHDRSCRGSIEARAAGDRAAAGVRPALRRRGAARVQPAHGAAAQPAVRVRAPDADRAGGAAGRSRWSLRWCSSAISRVGMIVSGRPLFYLFFLVDARRSCCAIATRAQRWLDQRFFRDEYDAREILVSLAGRVPYEADPRDLVDDGRRRRSIRRCIPKALSVLASDAPHGSNPAGCARAGRRCARRRHAAGGRQRRRSRCCNGPTSRSKCSWTMSSRRWRECRPPIASG